MDEYQSIRDGSQNRFRLDSLDDLSDALVKARIARGLTQRDLAERLGVTEQMVQRDEAGRYAYASLSRVADVADALGFAFRGCFEPAEQESRSTRSSQVTTSTKRALPGLTQRWEPQGSGRVTPQPVMAIPATAAR
jgi:transcriptional regulator with XRE-family HTH domain